MKLSPTEGGRKNKSFFQVTGCTQPLKHPMRQTEMPVASQGYLQPPAQQQKATAQSSCASTTKGMKNHHVAGGTVYA